MTGSLRFRSRANREINKDSFIQEWPETGLVLFNSPADPKPRIRIQGGRIVELDGRPEAEFDILDRFIARRAIDVAIAEESMATDSLAIARMLVDIAVPRASVVRIIGGLTPAKIMEVVNCLNVVEMMMALQKMRARSTPSNQAHVTNKKENPALLAADAAEAVERGFAELETTVGVARYAPFNAMAILIGSQTGRGCALTQCAVEEALGLRLAFLGLTTYAETLSVYGTEQAFHDGDDTPWSKAFLASAYASRGVKVRFTSGTGSEALMGHAEGKSMIYLEARCLLAIKGAGSQGVQNGSISCIALPESLPGGVRGVLAENLIAAMLDLELASGNDAMASHSDIRKASKLMLQFLPGTDFIFSGYSSMPREDNLFGGGNFDAEDLDDYGVLQRDMLVDGGLRPVREAETLAVRRRAAQAIQAVFRELGLPPITDAEVEAAVIARASVDMPDRDVVSDLDAATEFLRRGLGGVDVIRALARQGFRDIAEKILAIQKLRVSGDYLQTSAVVLPDARVQSAVNDPNDYRGPGTGYHLDAARYAEICDIPQALDPRTVGKVDQAPGQIALEESGPAARGTDASEIVIAIGPAFGCALTATLLGLPHGKVLGAMMNGIRQEGMRPRVVKIYATSDCGFVGHAGAQLSGSGIAIGIQSKGTTVIHRRDLEPLNNLELFPQAPNLTLESYRVIGRNAAKYAKRESVLPVPVQIDNMARLKYIVRTTILHLRETEQVDPDRPPQEIAVHLPQTGEGAEHA
ncbi:MAG TPA: propanediol/glycerol family dehydratase large subunit [Bryobacteraceae bacterium]|nr:propanediol/glycerol family dehydratase large subunit [Bryobacteraceae bacterium]